MYAVLMSLMNRFHEIHHFCYSENPGEYVVHAICRGLMPENLPSYLLRIKYVCMYFGNGNAEHQGTCKCVETYTCPSEPKQDMGSAAKCHVGEHTHTESELEGEAESGFECESINELKESQLGTEPGKAPDSVQQEPQQQGQQQVEEQQEEEQEQRQQCKWVEYLSQSVQQQPLKQGETQQSTQPHLKAPTQSFQALAQDQARISAQQKHQGPQLPPQAQTNLGPAPFFLHFPRSRSNTHWDTPASDAWKALEAGGEARRYQRQVPGSRRAKVREDPVFQAAAPPIPAGSWGQQLYGRPWNQASGGAMCDPSVTLGLLRDRPNIGDIDEYLENRYGIRYENRRM